MKKLSMRSIRGFLTHEDIEMLEEASKRQLKYAKSHVKKFTCNECNYNWLYSSLRCPVCSSTNVKRLE